MTIIVIQEEDTNAIHETAFWLGLNVLSASFSAHLGPSLLTVVNFNTSIEM